jgi:hypothetical protein
VNPADAVALDLTTTGADAQYVFALRDTGDSSPLWGLRVVMRPGTTGTEPPLVVDTRRIGALYLGTLAVDLDPYAGVGGANFKENLVDIRGRAERAYARASPTAGTTGGGDMTEAEARKAADERGWTLEKRGLRALTRCERGAVLPASRRFSNR